MEIEWDWEYTAHGNILRLYAKRKRFLKSTRIAVSYDDWESSLEGISPGLALLQMLFLQESDELQVSESRESVEIQNTLFSLFSDIEAQSLGCVPKVPFEFKLLSSGVLGGVADLKIWTQWRAGGRNILGVVEGATIVFGSERYRLPKYFQQVIKAVENFNGMKELRSQTVALADLKRVLDDEFGARASSVLESEYVNEISVKVATGVGLDITTDNGEIDFSPSLFNKKSLDANKKLGTMSIEQSVLSKAQSADFSDQFRQGESVNSTYVLTDGQYVIIEPDLRKVLQPLKDIQKGSAEEKFIFVQAPQKVLREKLKDSLEGLVDDHLQDSQDALNYIFVETEEFSERIRGLGYWNGSNVSGFEKIDTDWFPDDYVFLIKEQAKIVSVPSAELFSKTVEVRASVDSGSETIDVGGVTVRPTMEVVELFESALPSEADLSARQVADKTEDVPDERPPVDPEEQRRWALQVAENYNVSTYIERNCTKRLQVATNDIHSILKESCKLKSHQSAGLDWLCTCYRKGYPGSLLADDMGLGKTLQALVFARLVINTLVTKKKRVGPVLVVAPIGLLKNWEREHEQHLSGNGLGTVARVYGAELKNFYIEEKVKGNDMKLGRASLDNQLIGQSDWILTTYETYRDYHISFAKIPFSLAVMDEIQKAKNPNTSISVSLKSLNAEFKLGMTGTPVENGIHDLWNIMDILSPGRLPPWEQFRVIYPSSDAEKLEILSKELCEPTGDAPPSVLRRMKKDELVGLPEQTIEKHVRDMGGHQLEKYELTQRAIRDKRINHLNGLRELGLRSLHPDWNVDLTSLDDNDYIDKSARIQSFFQVLDQIKERGEKAIVFIQESRMQPIIASLIKRRYELPRPPYIINGKVKTASQRQDFVDSFQNSVEGEFDVMILSPRTGGVGYTLTKANHAIHLSRWWNPAVEDQCNDRIYRIGQEKDVFVHYCIASHPVKKISSFDDLLDARHVEKRKVADGIFSPATELSDTELKNMRDELIKDIAD